MKLIIFELCDIDYGGTIKEAVEIAWVSGLYESAGEDCVWWKLAVVKLTEGLMHLSHFKGGDGTEKYLMENLNVYASDKFPTYDVEGLHPKDDNGGSVMLDLTRGFVATF